MIHPFAHMTSLHAFASQGLDTFGRAPGRPADAAPGAAFRAAADETAALPSEAKVDAVTGGGSVAPLETRPAVPPQTTPETAPGTAETATDEAAAERPLPHIPRYAEVPADQQWPDGPYRQAPPEYGGEWWQVSPFTGEQPWLQLDHLDASDPADAAAEAVDAPQTFTRIFGPPPEGGNQVERIRWKQDLEHFKQAGIPEGFTAEQVEQASQLFESWGLGRPQFYEGRYGWAARFPDSAIPDFQANPHTALTASHLVVARYQVRLAQEGGQVADRHPFVPPQVFGDEQSA